MPTPAVVFGTSVFYRHAWSHPICYTRDLEHEKGVVNSYTLSGSHLSSVKRMRDTESWLVDGEQCPEFSCSSGRLLLVGTHLLIVLLCCDVLWDCTTEGCGYWRLWILRSKPATWTVRFIFREIAESCDDKGVKYIIYKWHCLHCSLQNCHIWSLIEIKRKAHTMHWLVISLSAGINTSGIWRTC